jgi:oxygen-independent coproporphyrinogen III oxidase
MVAVPRLLPVFPSRLDVPCDVLASHARPGPRYTSYPPATQFRSTFDRDGAAAELAAIADGDAISFYAHIPFCSQLCWYCGCNVEATRDRSKGTAYVDVLLREIALVAGAMGGRPRIVDLSLGGGSPNFLEISDLGRLLDEVRARFDVPSDAMLGIELDPRDTRPAQIDALAALGFRRVSVGVQDFDEGVQRIIHRHQSADATRAVIERARARGFTSINVDLVYGLPGQSPDSVGRTLDEVVKLAPDRLAVFGYAHLPHLRPHQRLVERLAPVPGIPARIELLRVVMDKLADAGYVRVGLDHFARPDDPLARASAEGRLGRNFQGYVVHATDRLIGVGASAISDSGRAYWQNHVDVAEWTGAVLAGQLPVARGVALDADDELRRFIIMRLMCDGRLDFADVEARYGVSVNDTFRRELFTLSSDHAQLVDVDRDRGAIVATPLGHHLIRNIAAVFDRYAGAATGSPTI